MRLSRIHFTALLALALAIGALCGIALATQTHMVAARGNLNAALTNLNAAVPDKGGHRANAINLVNQALTQVNMGIAAGAK